MPVENQCENCRFYKKNGCPWPLPTFNGAVCDKYVQKIDLEKKDDKKLQYNSPSTENPVGEFDAETDQPSKEGIHGWLSFFLIFFVGIGSVLSLISTFIEFKSGEDFLYSSFDVLFSLVYLATGIFTIYAFHKRDTDAVFLAKTFVLCCFASNLISLSFNDISELGGERGIARMVRSLVWCLIWFIFLFTSKQVKSLIPKAYRRTKTRDWVLIGILVLMPVALIGYAVGSEINDRRELETAALANLSLEDNQYSDGKIVFSVPEGMECEETFESGLTVFSLSDPDTEAEVIVVSDYDDDVTQKNFNQYWDAWKLEDLDGLKYDVISDEKQSDDNITVFYKMIRISLDDPIDWEFALIFDRKSGKVCVMSAYSYARISSPVVYLMENLRFL